MNPFANVPRTVVAPGVVPFVGTRYRPLKAKPSSWNSRASVHRMWVRRCKEKIPRKQGKASGPSLMNTQPKRHRRTHLSRLCCPQRKKFNGERNWLYLERGQAHWRQPESNAASCLNRRPKQKRG